MCRLFVIVKFVILKLLLASISGLTSVGSAYEYGYHPSAEEFDGLLRDTHRTWTHDILKQQTQRKVYQTPPQTNEVRSYVPKYQHDSHTQPQFKPNQKRHDLQEYPTFTTITSNAEGGTVSNIGSTLDFHFDNDDEAEVFTSPPSSLGHNNKIMETKDSVAPSRYPLPEINLKPLTQPEVQKYSLNNIYQNNSHAHFPIYFTNPATGIVYAITELGKSTENITRTNGSIPIFITKEQYERDISILKKEYEHKCGGDNKSTKKTQILRPFSILRLKATNTSTTRKPQIIKFKKPLAQSAISLLKKPTPVVVRKEITVRDAIATTPRPLRKKKKQKNKRKNKVNKPKQLGHNNVILTKPIPNGPTIVKGTHSTTKRPMSDFYKLSTQLEKPNFGTTIFSTGVLPSPQTAGSQQWSSHRLNLKNREKRSVELGKLSAMDDTKARDIEEAKNTDLMSVNVFLDKISEFDNNNEKRGTILSTSAEFRYNVTADNRSEEGVPNILKSQQSENLSSNLENNTYNGHQSYPKPEKGVVKNYMPSKINEKSINSLNMVKFLNSKQDRSAQPLSTAKNISNSKVSKNVTRKDSRYDYKIESNDETQTTKRATKKVTDIENRYGENANSENAKEKRSKILIKDIEKLESRNKKSKPIKMFRQNYEKSEEVFSNLNKKSEYDDGRRDVFLHENITHQSNIKKNKFKKNRNIENIVSKVNERSNIFLKPVERNGENSKYEKEISIGKTFKLKKYSKGSFTKDIHIDIDALSKADLKGFDKFLNEKNTHHIEKRSVPHPNPNVNIPRFVKKSKNLNKEILPVIDNPKNGTATESPSEAQKQIPSTSNSLADKNPNRANSKSTISKSPKTQRKSSSGKKRNRHRKTPHNSRRRTKPHKKRKRIPYQTKKQNDTSPTNSTSTETSTARTIKEAVTKMVNHFMNEKEAKDAALSVEEHAKDDEEEDDDEYDDDDGEEDSDEDEEYDDDDDDDNDENGLREKPIGDNTSAAEEGVDFGAMEEEETIQVTNKVLIPTGNKKSDTDRINEDIDQDKDIKIRLRRRPAHNTNAIDDYDDDDDGDDDSSLGSNIGGFFRMIFYPVQVVMSSIMDTFAGGKEPEEHTVYNYPQYTSYHNTLKQHSSDDYSYDDDNEDYDGDSSDSSSLGGWLSSWFGLNRRNKKISSTTVAPSPALRRPSKHSNNWFQSWFGIGGSDGVDKADTVSNEDYDDYDKWFASWFGELKPKARKRTTTTTTSTSTTTQLPQVPILTIVDPMRNPQNWIGILAHHIINQTSSTTQNPLKDIWTKITTPQTTTTTTTTTENPDIPRKISYNKYQIWRLKPQDDSQVQALEEYKRGDDGIKLQWLKGPSLRGLTDVLVPPRMLVDFQSSLTFESIDHEVLIFDVGKAIAYEKSKEDYFFTTTQKPKRKNQNRYTNKPPTAMTWMRYYEFDDIVTFMESMRMRYPQLVELIHIGRSYEGRPLIVMKIESKEAAASSSTPYLVHEKAKLRHKKRIGLANAVFIEAGTHGMEWIAPATATWIINEILKLMKTNKTSNEEADLIRNTTWFVMPVLNPDGYVYSHEYDRFWKKSRSRHIYRPTGLISSAMTWLQKKKIKDKVCFGVDLDRNWNYQWGKRGSSKSPCNEFFAGPGPFSEPETKALSEFLMDYRTHIKLYISMQSYGQIISYPYKANTTYDAERLDDFLDVAMVGTDGLRKKGSKSRYKIDSTNDLVENRSGCSDAFVAYDVGIPFSYTLQLADNGVHGYLLPSSSIESTSRDAFEIIKAMLDYI